MAHCGYEATAVEDMLKHPIKALLTSIRGPKTDGDMVPEPTPLYVEDKPLPTLSGIPIIIEMTE
jgi:hypothetical protein